MTSYEKQIIDQLKEARECLWINPERENFDKAYETSELKREDTEEARQCLMRYAPMLSEMFPELKASGGIIESELTEIPRMKEMMGGGRERLFIKRDSDLPIAGSVKARGGIYEVLKYTERLALQRGILTDAADDHRKLLTEEARSILSAEKVQVGSTGNLGLSIGTMSAALGYQAIVHMSADAREWKKELLRSKGARVIEYSGDYSMAVKEGRKESDEDPHSYFVDDDTSRDLFLGYAVSGRYLKAQLEAAGVKVDSEHPLYVYLPCGVGGAPGGISFGLKCEFADDVHCIFIEPVEAPAMMLGIVTGKHSDICVQDIGLTGKTEADGLAVGRPSQFVGPMVGGYVDGCCTSTDEHMKEYQKQLYKSEGIFIEPSSCAAFKGYSHMMGHLKKTGQNDKTVGTHIIWATGGSLVPDEIRREMLK